MKFVLAGHIKYKNMNILQQKFESQLWELKQKIRNISMTGNDRDVLEEMIMSLSALYNELVSKNETI